MGMRGPTEMNRREKGDLDRHLTSEWWGIPDDNPLAAIAAGLYPKERIEPPRTIYEAHGPRKGGWITLWWEGSSGRLEKRTIEVSAARARQEIAKLTREL